jgi:hypothetical protein
VKSKAKRSGLRLRGLRRCGPARYEARRQLVELKDESEVMTGVEEELKLIRQIVAGGGRKYTAGNIGRSRYDRLVDLGWLIPFKINISDVEYQVTDEGRAAAAAL